MMQRYWTGCDALFPRCQHHVLRSSSGVEPAPNGPLLVAKIDKLIDMGDEFDHFEVLAEESIEMMRAELSE